MTSEPTARSRRRRAPWFLGAGLGLVLGIAAVAEVLRDLERPPDLPGEGCLDCHEPVPVSASHPEDMGCVSCHLGNPLYLDADRAHAGMIARPSELAVVDRTCGQADCHPDQVDRVRDGLMATHDGIAAVLAFQFGEAADPDGGGPLAGGVPALLAREPVPGGSLAEDHFRKFCATCHLHKPLGEGPGEIGTRGGGCADCHLERPAGSATLPAVGQPGWAGEGGPEAHPRLTTAIDSAECEKCHNRSARIALSYRGWFEDEGDATPYHRGGPSRRSLSGGRSAQRLLPDVHQEAGLVCVDCHLGEGVMGDGERHTHMEQQVAVVCEDCHDPRWSGPLPDEPAEETAAYAARRSGQVNENYAVDAGARVALARSGAPIPHLQRTADGPRLWGRADGAVHEVPPTGDAPYHAIDGHGRLSCQACHSPWTPQCYGCHEVYHRDEPQLDWLAGRETPGRWEERRSHLRFERPTLGIGPGGTVQPFAPGCQVFVTERGEGEGAAEVVADRFPALAMAAFDPHTTRTQVVSCAGCHLDPKVLGLGDGVLDVRDGQPVVTSAWSAARSGLDLTAPLDAFVAGNGAPLQTTSRTDARPFDGDELRAILAVGACLPCHDAWDDPVWVDWQASVDRWREDASLPCRRILP